MNRRTRHFYEFGPFRVDAIERLLFCDAQSIPLKPKVFDLLLELVMNSGHILTKDELMKQVWPDAFVEDHNLTVSIFALRKALADDKHDGNYIETIPRRGYRFVASVKEMWDGVETGASAVDTLVSDRQMVKSIAVLPFKPIGLKKSDDEYLGLGMADALILRIRNLSQLVVRPTSAVRKYANTEYDAVAVGHALGVSSILDGSIQRSGRRIRVTVQLVDVKSSATLWAEKFDERFTSIFEVEDSISEPVARALTLKLSEEERKSLRKRYTDNTEAHQAYLKGRFFLGKRTPENLQKAFVYFKEAIRIDPEYALAYAGLADHFHLVANYNVMTPREASLKAKETILKALALDDTIAEAHVSLAYYREFSEWNWAEAEKEFRRAIELNPNNSWAHQWYSIYLRLMARWDEATDEIRKAQEIDPLSPNINTTAASLLYFSHRYESAADELEKIIEFEPDFVTAHIYLGLTFEQQGRYEQAVASFEKAMELSGDLPELFANLAHVYALSGRREKTLELLNLMNDPARNWYVSPYDVALVHAGLGESAAALDWIERAYEERSENLALLKVDPRFDGLRAEPRFADVMRGVGLG
jgi:DNA-binding winged helix-turn-helix (wHTH) protein/tetratricopeptide (TPR) repeat protein